MKCCEAWTREAGTTSTETLEDCRGTCQPTVDPNKQHSCNHTQGGRCLQIVDWLCRNDDDANGRCATDVGLYRMLDSTGRALILREVCTERPANCS
mmetsp:Transcript_52856/g.126411  ORF Transcript_52856/g.126411 Transcript_52856/m.126411 type:complete len:96 (+) Transcript_52856:594-881(+)